MGPPLYCSAAVPGMWGERGYGDGSTPYADSAVSPCFHGCLAFLHRHFPPQSPPSQPLNLFLCSPQQPSPWDCSTIPKPQPSYFTFQGTSVPVQGMYGCGKDCLILVSFRMPLISCFTLSLKCFFSDSDWTPASVPSPAEGRSSRTNTPVFPGSPFVLPSFVWFYIFFSTGQVLLSSVSWYSA